MSAENDTGLPASIEAAWGVRSRPGHGPKPGLSLERIVAAAVALASAEGLAAVSMVRVARDLGVSTMALYRYVAAKDELLDLMMDASSGLPPTAHPDEGWREGLSRWAWSYLNVLRRHPWMLQIPISGPPIGPNQIAWLEAGLIQLAGSGIAESAKLSVVMMLSGTAFNWAGLSSGFSSSTGQRPPIDYGRALRKLIDAHRFPAISAAIDAGAIDDELDEADAEFDFRLARLLDGVAALIDQSSDAKNSETTASR